MTRLGAVQTTLPRTLPKAQPLPPRVAAAKELKPRPHRPFEKSQFEQPAPTRGDLVGSGTLKLPVETGAINGINAIKSPAEALLARGEKALAVGDYAGAKKAFEDLQKLPGSIDLIRGQGLPTGILKIEEKGGNKTKMLAKNFKTSNAEVAKNGLAQAAQLEKMAALMGRKAPATFDPHNMKDMQDYFQKFSQGKSTAQVQGELQSCLKLFYVHAGEGVDWNQRVAGKDRPAMMGQMLANQPTDASGRKVIDCEGFTFLTGAILGAVKEQGKPRFDLYYIANTGHEQVVVFDNKKGGSGFDVSNAQLTPRPNLPSAKRFVIVQHEFGQGNNAFGQPIVNTSPADGTGD